MGREGATAVLQKQSKKLAFSLESANTLKYVVIHGDNWTKETDREVFDVVGILFCNLTARTLPRENKRTKVGA